MPDPTQPVSVSSSKSDSHELSPYSNYDFSSEIITSMIGYHEEPGRFKSTPSKNTHLLHNEITNQNDSSTISLENSANVSRDGEILHLNF